MQKRPVELRVGGHAYRVNSSASEAELGELADMVEVKLRGLGAAPGPHEMFLAAMALAHELREERRERERLEERSAAMMERVLAGLDGALGGR